MRTAGSLHRWSVLLLLSVAVLVACGGQKEPAQKAIADAEAAITAMRADAGALVPDELNGLDESVAALKTDFARNDFNGVLAAAPVLMTRISAMQETIATKKAEQAARVAELTSNWRALSAEVPQMVEAVNVRVDSLTRTRKFPAGMNATGFENARVAASEMTDSWKKALGAFANNNMEEAVGSAQQAKQKGVDVMNTLRMKPSS
jgi:hypothetical protein